MKIIISQLHEDTRIGTLARELENFGVVTSIRIRRGNNHSFAIAEMPWDEEAEGAIQGLDGREYQGLKLRVREAEW